MDERQAKRFRDRAIFSARKRGFTEQAEDLAQDVLLKFISGSGTGQTVDQAVIDAVRGSLGDSRSHSSELRRNFHLYPIGMDDLAASEVPRRHPQDRLGFESIIQGLNSTDRAVVCLRFIWGLDGKEIGHCFGVTESRISQRLQRIQAGLSEALSREEQRTGEREEPAEVSPEIQDRRGLDEKTERVLETIRAEARARMDERAGEAIPETLCSAFTVNAF